jgi:hypothetical protein
MTFNNIREKLRTAILGVLSAAMVLALLCSLSLQKGFGSAEFKARLVQEQVISISGALDGSLPD